MAPRIDVLGLGGASVDDILFVDRYPAADSKTRVAAKERHAGGLTATALVAASRLGARTAYAGALDAGELARFVRERLGSEGVDLSFAREVPGAVPVHSIIVVDRMEKTRNIFHYHEGEPGALLDWPPEEVLRSARVLFVDPFGVEGMTRAATAARAAGIPVVADMEVESARGYESLLDLIDHLILSREAAANLTGEEDPARAVLLLRRADRELAAVTDGRNGCFYLERGSARVEHQEAFAVESVDTTGCGDVFHGAYAAALARGAGLRERLRFASAAAALKATRSGGQAGIPTWEAVDSFLEARP